MAKAMSHSNKTKKMLEEELRTLHSRLADLQELDAQNRQAEGDKSKEKYRTLTQNIAGMIYTGLPDWSTDVILNSKAVCGYPPEDFNLRRIGWLDLVHPDDREEVERQAQRLTCSRESIVQQYRIVDRDGNVRWVEDHKTSRFSSEGVYEGVDGIVFDVTDRKRAEDELRKMRDELETRVKQRTADLAEAVEELKYEIEERHKAEQKLRDSHKQLRQLASELSLAEERLRRRLATDIHDLIGQNLAISKLRLESLRESVSSSEAAQSLDEIIDTMGETIESTRLMTFELSPPVLYELGFEPAVEWLLRKMSQQHELSTNFSTDQMCKPLPINLRCWSMLPSTPRHAM